MYRAAPGIHVRNHWLILGMLLAGLTLVLLWWPQALMADLRTPTSIPRTGKVPEVDGQCDQDEYADAVVFEFPDAFEVIGKVFLKHDANNLYVCMVGASSINSTVSPFTSVYLDTNNGRESFAQNEDLGLRVAINQDGNGAISAVRGTGSGNYSDDPSLTGWEARATTGNRDQAEWQIPLQLIRANRCDAFGLAVYHHWITTVGDDYGWPSNTFYDVPETWQTVRLADIRCDTGKIAYVYRIDSTTASLFKTMLEGRGFSVELILLSDARSADFSPFDLIIIADDTGDLQQWPPGTPGSSPVADHIRNSGKPILGLGEGGYAFFGKHGLGIGWPNGWHGPHDRVSPQNTSLAYWREPTDFSATPPDPLELYTVTVNEVGIYLPSAPTAVELGLEPGDKQHAPLIYERGDCTQLWGFSGGSSLMTPKGQDLFVNAVVFGINQQCPRPVTPPEDCVTLRKTADPPAGTLVGIGAVINYTITYTVKDDPRCARQRAVIEDSLPDRTLFVPNSAGAGITPGADRVIRWDVGPLAAGATGERKFAVSIIDAICNGKREVMNQARLVTEQGIFTSNTVTHPVDCPPVIPDGTQPPYAQDEIQIYPYPLVAGRPTDLSVRIRNLRDTPQTVNVTFESSPNNFGIGIPFNTLPATGNPQVVTLPPSGVVEVKITWTPSRSGHYCIRVRIQGTDSNALPVFTYRNLDVMEDLRPGVTDELPFIVGNPTDAVATVNLIVDNTCPGWSASVTPTQLLNMTPGEVRNATLTVIPPNDRPLGTACHIDVQGWIGDQLIGGIRKLDVPPVHLPPANPPWMEKEIKFRPDPPILNRQGEVCIELQNPMPFARTVSVDFEWADFGAGIIFAPISSLNNITLPPNSIDLYCVPWTPVIVEPTPTSMSALQNNASLHRCIRVRLRQAGFRDQLSQRNVDVRRLPVLSLNDLAQLEIPIRVGNPNDHRVPLQIDKILVGLPPELVIPRIWPDPPPELLPGQTLNLTLGFKRAATQVNLLADELPKYGDTARIDVNVLLDGESVGGFTVEFEQQQGPEPTPTATPTTTPIGTPDATPTATPTSGPVPAQNQLYLPLIRR